MVLAPARQALAVIASTPVNPDDPALSLMKAKDCRQDQPLHRQAPGDPGGRRVEPGGPAGHARALTTSPGPIHMAARHGAPVLRALARTTRAPVRPTGALVSSRW